MNEPTTSTEEAMGLLTNAYPYLIAKGKEIGREIALTTGSVTSRQIRDRMSDLGLLNDNLPEHWLGKVLRGDMWHWKGSSMINGKWENGETYTYSDPNRNIHNHTGKVWELAPVRLEG